MKPTMPDLADIRETFEIRTHSGWSTCPVCQDALDLGTGDVLDKPINHVLRHGWRLLHVGSEWDGDSDGEVFSQTVAILGKPVS